MNPGITLKLTSVAAICIAVLAVAACGGDSKAPVPPTQQPPAVPSGGRLAEPGSAGEAVLDLWRFLKAGAIPPALLSYEPRARRTVGATELAAALQGASSTISPLRPRVASVNETPNGTIVTVRAVGGPGPGTSFGYVLVKRGRRWLVVYDTLVEQQLRAYVTQQTQAGITPKAAPTAVSSGASAAGARQAANFAASVVSRSRAKKRPASTTPSAGTTAPAAATPPAGTP